MGDHPAWGVALLRMMLGVIFVMHGWYAWAIIGPRDLTDLMVRVGNPPGIATLLAWYTIAAHLIGGALLTVGFLTPWAALGQVPITAGGLFLFRWPQGFFLHGTLTEAGIAPGDHHPRALSQEPPGYGQAKAGGTAGDQRTLALQHTHGRSV